MLESILLERIQLMIIERIQKKDHRRDELSQGDHVPLNSAETLRSKKLEVNL
jgi:hypothetical protein